MTSLRAATFGLAKRRYEATGQLAAPKTAPAASLRKQRKLPVQAVGLRHLLPIPATVPTAARDDFTRLPMDPATIVNDIAKTWLHGVSPHNLPAFNPHPRLISPRSLQNDRVQWRAAVYCKSQLFRTQQALPLLQHPHLARRSKMSDLSHTYGYELDTNFYLQTHPYSRAGRPAHPHTTPTFRRQPISGTHLLLAEPTSN
jgi:hypothetical protein